MYPGQGELGWARLWQQVTPNLRDLSPLAILDYIALCEWQMRWLVLTANLTQPTIIRELGLNEELSKPSWPVGLSVGDCLDVQSRQKDPSWMRVAQFHELWKSPGKGGLYMGKQAA